MNKGLAITFLFFFSFLRLTAADTIRNPLYFGLRAHYGFIIPHSVALRGVTDTQPTGLELTLGKVLISEDAYSFLNNFAKAGISLFWTDFNKPATLGHAVNLSAFAEPVFMFRNRIYAGVKTGMGISYLTRIYDEETNPDNKFFAFPFSFMLYVNPGIHYKLSSQFHVSLSASYNHISNGGVKQPNYGMNFPTMTLGAEYTFNDYELPGYSGSAIRTDYDLSRAFDADIFMSVKNIDSGDNFEGDGLGEGEQFDAKLLWIYGLQIRASRPVSHRNTLSIAGEWIVDNYTRERIRRAGVQTSHHKVALLAGHEFVFGRTGFRQQLGFYMFAPFEKEVMYQRYTLWYRLSERYTFSASLKSHLHQADIFDARFGVRF